MDQKGTVGPLGAKVRGSSQDFSLSRYGELVGPMWREATLAGRVFGGETAAAGVAPGTALGTTGPFTLANPAGSGVALVVIQGSYGYVSGTLGAGVIVWAANVNPVAAAVTGTAITVNNMLLGGARADGQGLAFTTSTLPVAPVGIRPAFNLDASLATTAGIGLKALVDYVDGAICIAPGGALTLQGIAAAGTTPLVIEGSLWEEVSL